VQYLTGAEPLFIEGPDQGCLLLHGAGGGTTWDLKEFAQKLHADTNMTVYIPALTGFGTKPEDLLGIKFTDWWNDAQKGLEKLSNSYETLYVVGHSMGGLLTLLLATEYPEIRAVVTWAAPLNIKNRLLKFLPLLIKTPLLNKLIPNKIESPAPKYLIEQGWIGYNWIPPDVGLAVVEGLKRLKIAVSKITCPTFLIQGTNDEMVGQRSAEQIYEKINSSDKKKWYIEGATHPIMNNLEFKDELFKQTIAFLKSH